MSAELSIIAQNLSKSFQIYDKRHHRLLQMLSGGRKQYHQEFWALKDVSFEVKKGETVGIVGKNGSGKSTLLQLICGTVNPTNGIIKTKGRIAAILELGSGFDPEFTGRENVYINGMVLGLSNEEINARFDDIASFADIGAFIEQPIKTYSSGMLLRLAFAVQAMVNPAILIVDEALAVGDEKFQRKCIARLEKLKNDGTSIIFVSHSAPQIIELCDRALLLNDGVRLMYARPTIVVKAYQKLIYAPAEHEKHLVQEYLSADKAEKKSDGISNMKDESIKPTFDEEYFDPKLVPETSTIFPILGAELLSFKITDTAGNNTNLLHGGHDYQFEVHAKFLTYTEKAFFAIHICNKSGVGITGQRYPCEGEYLGPFQAGQQLKISFGFKIILVEGTYFVGGGIWSNQDQACLHRIFDAIMFRVISTENPNSFGYCDATSSRPFFELL